jgi:hypothetical protein
LSREAAGALSIGLSSSNPADIPDTNSAIVPTRGQRPTFAETSEWTILRQLDIIILYS